ncbi:MAG: mevalonate kinase [Chloroflexota bacterium]|nr:mevalonate kinase [Chloroflexota bacterium]
MNSQASAPGKAILFGEHAVVYGIPAIAIPLSNIRVRATCKDTSHPLTVIAEDLARPAVTIVGEEFDRSDPLSLMAALTMGQLNTGDLTGEIRIRSDIPVASGLGSGAAVSAALGRAIALMQDCVIADGELSKIVFEVEKLHHGTPSGIDNTVVVYEKPVYFVKDEAMDFIRFGEPLHIIIGDTGIASLTRDAVAHVRTLYEREPAHTATQFDEIGDIVNDARACIESGATARLGELMTANHHLLRGLNVSSAELDRLVEAALGAGALGAKMSGGGRGGNVIALVNDRSVTSVKDALVQAGAKRLLETVAR